MHLPLQFAWSGSTKAASCSGFVHLSRRKLSREQPCSSHATISGRRNKDSEPRTQRGILEFHPVTCAMLNERRAPNNWRVVASTHATASVCSAMLSNATINCSWSKLEIANSIAVWLMSSLSLANCSGDRAGSCVNSVDQKYRRDLQ